MNHDLSDDQLARWTQVVSDTFESVIAGHKRAEKEPWFVNGVELEEVPADGTDTDWTAYPKRFPAQYAKVDATREMQDEYCEWAIERRDGKISTVTFSTETPDYFTFLNSDAPDVLLELYRRYVSREVQLADIQTPSGDYDATNDWNLGVRAPGRLLHMAQSNNTFSAAADLSAGAAWPAVNSQGNPVTGEQTLTDCLRFGIASRHSDPHIGAQVNAVVVGGAKVALADPVGLYINRILLSDIETPDDSPVTEWFAYDDDRGADGFRTRVRFSAPSDSAYSLSDLTVDGSALRHGGQLAEKIKVRIRAWALATTDPALPPVRCQAAQGVEEPRGIAVHATNLLMTRR